MRTRSLPILGIALAVVLPAAATACGPGPKPLSVQQKAHMAVSSLKAMPPLGTASELCMRGIIGGARDKAIEESLNKLFEEEYGKGVAGGVFKGFQITGDSVRVYGDFQDGQPFSGLFDLGKVLSEVIGLVPDLKLFGLVGPPAIDCLAAAFWLDGTLGGQVGTWLRQRFHPTAPGGVTAYVVNGGDGTVTPISLPDGTPGPPIRVGSGPLAIAITPDGKTAYVTNHNDDTVTPISLPAGTPGTSIRVGKNPDAIAISPDGSTAYVANSDDNTVTPISLPDGTPGPPIRVGAAPIAIAITP